MFKHTTLSIITLALTVAVASTAPLVAQHENHARPQAAPPEQPAAPYLLETDSVTGERLGARETLVTAQHEGRELLFNSEESAQTFRANPARFLATIDEALIRAQRPQYPLATCLVSGEKLGGSMGDAIDVVHGNRLVRFCCKGCIPKFKGDPASYLAKLDAAVIAAQIPAYPLKKCIVSGEALGGSMGEPIDYVVGNRLVRLCCNGCKKKIAQNPLKYLRQLDEATASPASKRGERHSEGGHDEGGRKGGGGRHDDHGDH